MPCILGPCSFILFIPPSGILGVEQVGRRVQTDAPAMSLNFSVTEKGHYITLSRDLFYSFSFFLNIALASCFQWASLVAQTVKNPPAMQETWV